ncbi:hypothetical protein PT974_03841 [Cladobotryum mycophilum]|uniref:X-Pro dipeptidyl-peptidase n=1 Tax=Cladobotryum mycophilum TaxID=491253 RepID=A0ABR0SUL2_9HYPO
MAQHCQSAAASSPSPSSASDLDVSWVSLHNPIKKVAMSESMPDRVRRIGADLDEIDKFYTISIAPRRHARLDQYYAAELNALASLDFSVLSQQDRVDFLLLRNLLRRKSHQLQSEKNLVKEFGTVMPFSPFIISLCEARQNIEPLRGDLAAQRLDDIRNLIIKIQGEVENDGIQIGKTTAYKASKVLAELRGHLQEFFTFYSSYDPMFDWWVTTPWQAADAALAHYITIVQTRLVGKSSGDKDEIIGEPIGRETLLVELDAEMIAYSPDELIELAHEQYQWCETQMKQASNQLGFGDDWKKALDYVKTRSVPPGEQTNLVRDLIREGAKFVQAHDLVTVPMLAQETCRMFMMSPEMQKVAPFFLGGPYIQVAYPTAEMPHDLKKMVMRGNNRHFARATAFHEMIPGHRLQLFMAERHNSHRQLFSTPFSIEGWAMYWEFVLWQRGDFFVSPEDRIGTLFWRMHRCARIIFSLKFHLGQMTPQECIDLLVNWVGHERSTAEGEVRRSFNGDYGPLYQAGYMLGALQLFKLRKEALDAGQLTEKEFNDTFLQSNFMPIELFRDLVFDLELSPDYKPHWKFYG